MSEVIVPAVFGAALLAMCGAMFGILIARAMWVDDLQRANETLASAQRIKTLHEETIEILKRMIEIYQRRDSR